VCTGAIFSKFRRFIFRAGGVKGLSDIYLVLFTIPILAIWPVMGESSHWPVL
jgi:hypothetical protein